MKTYFYTATFVGRRSGSIGITYKIKHVFESKEKLDEDGIFMLLYNYYECISDLRFTVEEFKHADHIDVDKDKEKV